MQEQCDDGNLIEGDGCDSNCRFTACGNGVRTDPEECDDGNTRNADGSWKAEFHGTVDVRIIYDHRVMDGATVARVLGKLEEILNGPLLDELNAMAKAK